MRKPDPGGFRPEWLALRAAYDERARDGALLPPFAGALNSEAGEIRLTDLGSGTGANFLYLAPLIGELRAGAQKWRLIDRDSGLLDRARARISDRARMKGWDLEAAGDELTLQVGGMRWSVTFRCLDLSSSLESVRLERGEAVVLSALLDLVSPAWLQRLVDWIAAARSPMLAALTYDGHLEWSPADADDDRIRALFNDHQRRDKGFGPALGPSAPSWIATRLMAAGYAVDQRPSPWLLGAGDAVMLNALSESIASSAAEQDPQARRLAAGWSLRRTSQAEVGLLSATIGHADVLARP